MAELDVFTSYDGASGDSVGAYFATHAQDPSNATRSTARTAYYNPFVNRPSLHLLTSRQVTRVITESTSNGPKVTGVEVIITRGDISI
jgi:choline dehydrogenase